MNSKTHRLLLLALQLAAWPCFAGVNAHHLRCEYRDNPLGIDAAAPRLSWRLQSGERLPAGFDRSCSLEDHNRFFSPQNHFEDDVKLPPVQAGTGYCSTTLIAIMDVNPDNSPVRGPLKQVFHQD